MSYVNAIWIGGAITDSNNTTDLKTSGFTDLFLWGGINKGTDKAGNTTYSINTANLDIVTYNSGTKKATWIGVPAKQLQKSIKAILASGSTIKNLHLMLGGGSWYGNGKFHQNETFPNLKSAIFPEGDQSKKPQTGTDSIVNQMFSVLQSNIPQITGINYDDEYGFDLPTNDALTEMLLDSPFNYQVSYIPAWGPTDFWAQSLKKFGTQISGIYLQIYSGSDPSNWIKFLEGKPYNIPNETVQGVIRPVLYGCDNVNPDGSCGGSGLCPPALKSRFQSYQSSNFTGGGLWLYDGMRNAMEHTNPTLTCMPHGGTPTTQDYSNAVAAGAPTS